MFYSEFQTRRLASLMIVFSSICPLAVAGSSRSNPAQPGPGKAKAVSYGSLPLSFEPNLGQTDKQVQWLARGPEYTLYLSGHDAVLEMDKITPSPIRGGQPKIDGAAVRMSLVGARMPQNTGGEDLQPGNANYLTGNDSSKWQTNVPMYGKVRLGGVYPGIDLVYYGKQGRLEYDFVVAPGADPSTIRWNFDGAKAKLAENGDLVLPVTGSGPEVHFDKPVAYQTVNGVRQPVEASFIVAKDKQVSFRLGEYDKSRQLVIDPTLIFLGVVGTGYANTQSVPYGMAVDKDGEIILTGITGDPDYPVTTGALQTTCNTFSTLANTTIDHCQNSQGSSGFVTKISADGTSLVYATYLHGNSGNEYGYAVVADSSGDAYIEGATSSYDFPITSNAYQSVCQPHFNGTEIVQICNGYFDGGGTEYTINGPQIFLAELNPSGSKLIYATFFGGSAAVYPEGLALDSSGNMYFAGFPQAAWPSADVYPNNGNQNIQFPTTSDAVQTDGTGGPVASLSVLSADGSTLLYSTFLGDAPSDTGYTGTTVPQALAVGPGGMAYIGGYTNSSDYPVTAGVPGPTCPAVAMGREYCNNYIGFLSAIDTTNGTLVYSEYLGGPSSAQTEVLGLAADSSNNVYATGFTYSANYPTTTGVYQPTCIIHNGGCAQSAFLTKINSTGSAYIWSTYFTDTNNDSTTTGNAVALDARGQVYIYGYNNGYGWDMPVVNPIVPLDGNPLDYVATFSPDATKLIFSSPVFEAYNTSAYGVNATNFNGFALDSTGNVYVSGSGNDSGVIVTTSGTFASKGTGPGYRGYFAKISPVLSATTTTLAISTSTATFGQSVTFTASVAGTAVTTPTPTGTVTLVDTSTDPATTLGTITLGSNGSGKFTTASLSAAPYSVTATYSGDDNYEGSTSSAQALTINQATPSITWATPAAITYGTALSATQLDATSTVAGNFVYTPPLGTVLAGGTQTLSVSLTPTDKTDYTTATKTVSLTVKPAAQTITFAAMPAQPVLSTYTLTATASSGLVVTFKTSTSTICSISGSKVSLLATGYCSITASQAGNSDYAAAPSVGRNLQVVKATQTITFPAVASQPALGTAALSATASSGLAVSFTSLTTSVNESFTVTYHSQTITFNAIPAQPALSTYTLTATASSGLAVTYSTTSPTICTISGNKASLLAPGYCAVKAAQAGNSVYSAATAVGRNLQVVKATQTITFPAIASQPALSTYTLAATASSGLTVSFTSLTPSVCTVSGDTASLLIHGTCTVEASQAGNTLYSAAANATESFTVTYLSQTVTFNPVPAQKVNTTYTLTATASSGLPITYTTITPTICTVSGSSVSLNATGYCGIDASQPGDSDYSAAPSVGRNIQVVAAN